MFWKTKTLLAKIEIVYGTDSVPTGAANAILASNVTLMPMEGEDVSRNLERAFMGASPMLPAGLHMKLSFEVELAPSGVAGTAPGFGPLLRMCAVAETITAATRVEYTPVTSGHESGSIYFAVKHADGTTTRHALLGVRGTAVLRLNAQGIPVIAFTMTGLFASPTAQAAISPNYTAFKSPQIASRANTPTFTVGAVPMVLRSLEFDLGNDVQPRLLIGQETILIVDRAEVLRVTVSAEKLATFDPYANALNQTERAVQLIHGTGAGRITTLDLPRATQQRVSGLEVQQEVVEWPLAFVPQQNAGDDQWKLTFS